MIIDLHAHLGGSVPFHNLFEIGKLGGHRLGEYKEFLNTFAGPIGGPGEYFSRYKIIEPIQSGPGAINKSVKYSLVYAYTQLQHEGIELRFNPCFRNGEDYLDIDFIIIEAINGMRAASDVFGIKSGLILCLDHRLPKKANEAIIRKAQKYQDRGIIGLDLAGPEHEIEDFKAFYGLCKMLDSSGMKYTIHFGETIHTVGKMKELLEECSPNRLGHGISSLFNDDDLDQIIGWKKRKRNSCLEFCPKSNIVTGSAFGISKSCSTIGSLNEKVVERWYNNGVKFCVGTDAPALLRTSIKKQIKQFNNDIIDEIIKYNDKTATACSWIKGVR